MLVSRLFGKTHREPRSDMKLASHKLLYQAGFVSELSAGRYEYLPLGFIVWQKIINMEIDANKRALLKKYLKQKIEEINNSKVIVLFYKYIYFYLLIYI